MPASREAQDTGFRGSIASGAWDESCATTPAADPLLVHDVLFCPIPVLHVLIRAADQQMLTMLTRGDGGGQDVPQDPRLVHCFDLFHRLCACKQEHLLCQ